MNIRLFTQPAEKDHPERPGLINISRTRLVLLLRAWRFLRVFAWRLNQAALCTVGCAAIPLLVEHLWVHEHVVTTVTQAKSVETRAPVRLLRHGACLAGQLTVVQAHPDEIYDVRKRMLDRLEQRRGGEHGFFSFWCPLTFGLQARIWTCYASWLWRATRASPRFGGPPKRV